MLDINQFFNLFKSKEIIELKQLIKPNNNHKITLLGLHGSSKSVVSAACMHETNKSSVFILSDREEAAYFYNDLEQLFNETELNSHERSIFFFPASYNKSYSIENIDNANVLARTEIIGRLSSNKSKIIIVTYPDAIYEKVVSKSTLSKNSVKIDLENALTIDFLIEFLVEYDFERVDFVTGPGDFSVRGGIVDVFSYASKNPYRIEFCNDRVESIRTFDTYTQLSIENLMEAVIIPNLSGKISIEKRLSVFESLSTDTILWIDNFNFVIDRINKLFEKVQEIYYNLNSEIKHFSPEELFINGDVLIELLETFKKIEFFRSSYFKNTINIEFNTSPQPVFSKNYDLFIKHLLENKDINYKSVLLADNPKQIERLTNIVSDSLGKDNICNDLNILTFQISLHAGFIDKQNNISCLTDHQIFERYHKFKLRDRFDKKEAITLKEFNELSPGDYVTHIDHGIGRFGGLEKIEMNGKEFEAIRLVYKDNDTLYISVHSLHKISKFVGKDGTPPVVHRLGSNVWANLKNKTKQKVKDIAKDLIKLYAERKTKKGFAFSPDNYLQNELEASFLYEDTPDQLKSTQDIKKDMEAENPMDRLICGDVGFGKTEVAIRAAFKAVCDSKQVAVLVPTTILALQHYKTFSERTKGLPCKVDYINRFKSTKEQNDTLKNLKNGNIDILIGTHRLIGKDVEFKDLGLLIIDEEQKFGVAAKEKLKKIKVNVDTLTLTATPIPRTLQFSLMGARDLSIITTPPPNRHPIQTELHTFNEELIRDAISYELSRGGQVFFVHNRIHNIQEIAGIIKRLVPDARIAIGHGQLDGHKLEEIMLGFIEEQFDVLVATTIIEAGLDIPNANTIIINDAHLYGLSDLHQMRGRVGRANKKAFCYLLTSPLSLLTDDARKRLRAIEEFSDLGSGFNIAMRDLDIRGAGNILGGEQSGFIADIGFDMYQKILDEAIQELKQDDFKPYFPDNNNTIYVKECTIETDLDILFPNSYINKSSERLNLYKELDNLETDDELLKFSNKIIDRFGPIPSQTLELIESIKLRRFCKQIGFEKVVIKNKNMLTYFVGNQQSAYFQSLQFSHILEFLKTNPKYCRFKEGNEKLSLIFSNIGGISDAMKRLEPLKNLG